MPRQKKRKATPLSGAWGLGLEAVPNRVRPSYRRLFHTCADINACCNIGMQCVSSNPSMTSTYQLPATQPLPVPTY